MNRKGDIGVAVGLILLVLIIGVIFYFYSGSLFPWIKEKSETSRCSLSVTSSKLNLPGVGSELPKLNCEKIPIEIKGESKEDIEKELLALFVDMSNTFGVKETFSKITGTYCRKRYHPISFKKKGLVISGFDSYLKKNVPTKFLNSFSFVPNQINTNREYSLLLVVVYESEWNTFMKKGVIDLALTELGVYKVESQYLGFALVESDKILETLECDHLV